jgi:uncharacterized protein YkwD
MRRLLVLAAGALCVVLSLDLTQSASAAAASSSSSGCTAGSASRTLDAARARKVIVLVNAHRRSIGLRPLRTSRSLRAAAKWKAGHMARHRYLQHDDLGGRVHRSAASRLRACGYETARLRWGENIAMGQRSPAEVVAAWLRSPGHRANIDAADFRVTGVGVAVSRAGVPYWTQTFGT